MTKTKILIIGFILTLLLGTVALVTLQLTKPSKNAQAEVKINQSSTLKNPQSSINPFKKLTFDQGIKAGNVPKTIDYDPEGGKFTEGSKAPIRETDINKYSQVKDENLLYADDFVNSNCESYVLTLNSSQNCYVSFRKQVLESEVFKIKAILTPVTQESANNTQEVELTCSLLSIKTNPNQNAVSCISANLGLKKAGQYNLTVIVGEDVQSETLDRNIEALTNEDFQAKFVEVSGGEGN